MDGRWMVGEVKKDWEDWKKESHEERGVVFIKIELRFLREFNELNEARIKIIKLRKMAIRFRRVYY